MSDAGYVFEVEVEVTGWEDPGDGRTPVDYAFAALNAVCYPREAEYLDGYADLRARAHATVRRLP
jgi:hypothetical protein